MASTHVPLRLREALRISLRVTDGFNELTSECSGERECTVSARVLLETYLAPQAPLIALADEGVLSSARVIQRAKDGKLVDGSGATCDELAKIIAIDKKAVQFEKDKIEAQGSKADPAEKKIVLEAEKAIEKQLVKLAGLQKSKGC